MSFHDFIKPFNQHQWVSVSVTRLDDLLDFGNFLKPLAIINFPKSPTLLGNFCKGVKIYCFSSEIISGNFCRHLAIFFWSHWCQYCVSLPHKMVYLGTYAPIINYLLLQKFSLQIELQLGLQFFKWVIPGLFFINVCLFQQLTVNIFLIKFRR